MTSSTQRPGGTRLNAEIAIIGGGIAGLWLLNRLVASGYNAVLFEAAALGGGQTLASQGMIHGGLKYALAGALTRASEAIAAMPGRWRACLEGRGEIDLTGLASGVSPYYLFAAGDALGSLTSFFASRSLRGRIERVERADFPPAFADGFDGSLYKLNDFVVDARALVAAIAEPLAARIFQHRVTHARHTADGVAIELADGELCCRELVITAGTGTAALLEVLGIHTIGMQRRPLHQVLVRHRYPHPVNAHCLTGIRAPEPRLTITSHPDREGWLWYLGGRIATAGVQRDAHEQVAFARAELATCVPWLDWRDARFETLRIDRAESSMGASPMRAFPMHALLRPDNAFVKREGRVLVGWPTKLTLAPDLADRVLAMLAPPAGGALPALEAPHPPIAQRPWD